MLGDKTIEKLDGQLERNLKKELRDQGHYLTGRLEHSIESKKVPTSSGVSLETSAEDYIDDLENPISFDDPRFKGANSAEHIKAMIRYAKLRYNISDEEAIRAGVRIARKHRTQGMPTIASYQYSTNNRRTLAITHSYDDHASENEQLIEDAFSSELDDFIDKTFDQTIF